MAKYTNSDMCSGFFLNSKFVSQYKHSRLTLAVLCKFLITNGNGNVVVCNCFDHLVLSQLCRWNPSETAFEDGNKVYILVVFCFYLFHFHVSWQYFSHVDVTAVIMRSTFTLFERIKLVKFTCQIWSLHVKIINDSTYFRKSRYAKWPWYNAGFLLCHSVVFWTNRLCKRKNQNLIFYMWRYTKSFILEFCFICC